MRSQARVEAADAARVRDELMELAQSWRRVLADDPTHARPIVSSLLRGRVTFTPGAERNRWTVSREGTLIGLFRGEIYPSGWRPQRDSATGSVACWPSRAMRI
jgi:hypothetical protein